VTVAALYVETNGVYYGLPDVDPWDQARDARLYAGPHPVVAHPPCQLWTNMAAVNFKRYGGEHNRPGNDGGCFEAAKDAVLAYGGVLEHPANSRAWDRYYFRRPDAIGWQHEGGSVWVCEVWQSAYGHRARKRTWLLYCGENRPAELNWERPAGTHQVGWFDRIKPTLSKKEASATPVAFRDALLGLARMSRRRAGECATCGANRYDSPGCRCLSDQASTAVARDTRESMLSVVALKRDRDELLSELATAKARLEDNDPASALRRLTDFFRARTARTQERVA
jgi:hypothetical protein